jgi:exodeoxyribonuclease VII large subunit
MKINSITLLELNQKIKKIVRDNNNSYWIVAEISELKINFSGHCYLELIQKEEEKDQIVARSRATIWAATFRMIRPYFESTTKQTLREGISILVKVSVEFHEVFGLSLNITDIEPTYTVGELALQKQKIIERLQEEGVFEMNKELVIPELCQKIAVISSKTAAGYEDFEDQLSGNAYAYKFYTRLFPAIMQGEGAEKSIIAALDKVFQYESVFDAVVIIRGGGSQADLNCFNSYWLAYHITQFPLPVLTGIGHEQDDSVVDLVAHTRLKTPTAVAAYLVENLADTDSRLQEIQEQFIREVEIILRKNQDVLTKVAQKLQKWIRESTVNFYGKIISMQHSLATAVNRSVNRQNISLLKTESRIKKISGDILAGRAYQLQKLSLVLARSLKHGFSIQKQKIEYYYERINSCDPSTVLRRGYSVTMKKGKAVKDAALLAEGDILETILNKGKITSTLKKKMP